MLNRKPDSRFPFSFFHAGFHFYLFFFSLVFPFFSPTSAYIQLPWEILGLTKKKIKKYFFPSNFNRTYCMLAEMVGKPLTPIKCFYCMLWMTWPTGIKYFSLVVSVLIKVLLTSSWPLTLSHSGQYVSFPLVRTRKETCFLQWLFFGT